MSLKVIREQVLKFISQSSPSVIAIKGEWGVGKTFGWEALLLEAKSKGMISGRRYSYVSLFGISSLDKLKSTIFENSIQQNHIGYEPNLETLKNAFGMIEVFGRSSLNKIKDIPYVRSAAPAIEAFSLMSITDTIICIDDLERKGNALELKDVLGLVSLLKEKKKCKVVLLLNDGTEETADYEKYKEKVIDIELSFSPTPEESAQLAYNKLKPYHSELSQLTTSLGINNIRVLKKIEKNIDVAINLFDEFDSELTSQLLQTTTLFSWAYYCSVYDNNIPTLDFIESVGDVLYMDSKDLTDEHEKWRTLLLSYNFRIVDDLDKMIAKLVRSGYVDRDSFSSVISIANEKLIANRRSDSYHRAWDTFHSSFSDNQGVVISQLYNGFVSNVYRVSPNDLNSLVGVLRDLDENEKASDLIDYFISERKSDLELFNPVNFNFVLNVSDVEILDKFRIIYDFAKPKRNIEDVLTRISGKSGWGHDDEDVLSAATEDDYYNYFKSINGSHLTFHVSTCLKFGGFSNGSEKMESIARNARAALKRIASESKLNEIRMAKFGL